MNDTIQALIDTYRREREGLSERQKAELESQMWALAPSEVRRAATAGGTKRGKAGWLADLFGSDGAAYDHRYLLLHAGDIAEPLWHRLEHENLSRYTAVFLLREAREKAALEKRDPQDALTEVLAEYDRLPVAISPSGKTVRRRPGSKLPDPKKVMQKRHRKGVKASASKEDEPSFWNKIRADMAAHVAERLQGAEPAFIDEVWRGFERDLNMLIETIGHRLSRLAAEVRKGQQRDIGRAQVIAACRELGMDPPPPGKPVNMKLARLQRGRQGAKYHPDAENPAGAEASRLKFDLIMNAYITLDKYAEHFGTEKEAQNGIGGIGHGK